MEKSGKTGESRKRLSLRKRRFTVLLIPVALLLILLNFGCRQNNGLQTADQNKIVLGTYQEYCGGQFTFYLPQAYQQVTTDTDEIALLFRNNNCILKVFQQKLGDGLTAESYIEYGNEQLYKGTAGFEILETETRQVKAGSLRQITYKRPQLTAVENDTNYYTEVHLLNDNADYIITFWGKSDEDGRERLKEDLIETAQGVFFNNLQAEPTTRAKDAASSEGSELTEEGQAMGSVPQGVQINYSGKRFQFEILPHKLVWGRYYPGVPFDGSSVDAMLESEKKLGHKFEILMTYVAFPGIVEFPAEAVNKVYQDGRILMLTLQPFSEGQTWIAVPEIINGQYDVQIKEWAVGLKNIGEPVFVSPLNEMNSDWDPWCAWFFGKDTDLYIEAWRHIVDIFREAQADNVLFVWNPHDGSFPDFQWNNAHLYYPGDDYVDWIGLTGYNNGTTHPGDEWREFDEIYKPLYADYEKRYPDKPFIIAEFACNEKGGVKAKWIEKAMASIANNNYPNIKIAIWYDNQVNAWHYELDSSEEAFAAFQKGLGNIGFLKKAISISQ